MLVLSLFPGIGLLDQAFEEAGFCVVRGPDLLWGGDVRKFHPTPDRFDGVIGGPPCQAFSRLRHLVEHNGYATAPNLIPEFERIVGEAQPRWFLMENVPAAPTPSVAGYDVCDRVVNNRGCGGEQNRVRRFSFGARELSVRAFHVVGVALEPALYAPAVLASGGARPVPVAIGGSGKRKKTAARDIGYKTDDYFREAVRLQGLPDDFDLPAFTVAGKIKAVGNGVPLPMGREVAMAVKRIAYPRSTGSGKDGG